MGVRAVATVAAPVLAVIALDMTVGASFGPIAALYTLAVLVAAYAGGRVAGLTVAAVSAIAAGVAHPETATAGLALARAGLVGFVGVAGALLLGRVRGETERSSRDLLEQRRELAMKEAAIIQAVSHEFRSPLTVIQGAALTLQAPGSQVDPRVVESLGSAATRLGQLVERVLAAADALEDRRAMEHRRLAVRELLREVLGEIGADHSLVVLQVEPQLAVVSDAGLLGSLLRLVVENAVKFSSPGQRIRIAAERAGPRFEFRVRNHGPAIDADFMEKAFAAFTQQDSSAVRRNGGLGIGLFAAHHLARRLGGGIEIAQPAEDFTEVTIWVPQRRDEDHPRVHLSVVKGA